MNNWSVRFGRDLLKLLLKLMKTLPYLLCIKVVYVMKRAEVKMYMNFKPYFSSLLMRMVVIDMNKIRLLYRSLEV